MKQQPGMKKKISLCSLITGTILLCILTPFSITSLYFWSQMKSNAFSNIEKDLDTSAKKSFSSLDSRFLDIKNTYYAIMSDPLINPLLYENITQDSISYSDTNLTLEDRVYKIMFYNSLWNEQILTSIVIYENANSYVYINQDFSTHNALSFFLKKWEDYKFYESKNRRVNEFLSIKNHPDSIYYIRDYYNYSQGTFKGIITMKIQESALLRCFDDFSKYENSLCFIYDNHGNILADTTGTLRTTNLQTTKINGQTLQQLMDDRDNYMLKTYSLSNASYTAAILIPLKPIHMLLLSQLRDYIYIFTVLLLFFILIAILISKTINNYILILTQQMIMVSNGDYTDALPKYGITEVDNLSSAFHDMSVQIQKLLNEIYANEILLKESELKALQAQINPHFLFNTLLSISMKAKTNGDNETYELIIALNSLMNNSINTNKNRFITIHEEIQNVKSYLFIQNSRFGERMHYDIDIAQSIMQHPILKLIIQPIVENAIVHGLENKVGIGYVLIEGFQENNEIIIRITDNGVGFKPNLLESVLSEERHPDDISGHHIGLLNTHLRIRYTYGEPFGLEIKSAPGKGTCVTIRFPDNVKEVYNVSNSNS